MVSLLLLLLLFSLCIVVKELVPAVIQHFPEVSGLYKRVDTCFHEKLTLRALWWRLPSYKSFPLLTEAWLRNKKNVMEKVLRVKGPQSNPFDWKKYTFLTCNNIHHDLFEWWHGNLLQYEVTKQTLDRIQGGHKVQYYCTQSTSGHSRMYWCTGECVWVCVWVCKAICLNTKKGNNETKLDCSMRQSLRGQEWHTSLSYSQGHNITHLNGWDNVL